MSYNECWRKLGMSIKKEYQERSDGWISEPSSLGIKE